MLNNITYNGYEKQCPECNLGETKKMGSACGCWICPTCNRRYPCMVYIPPFNKEVFIPTLSTLIIPEYEI